MTRDDAQAAVPAAFDELAELARICADRCGRPPRVLHIGNIANNAYNNAKLLNAAGFDCDVICYDYYHIMGCPEWEDADFDGDAGDHFHPDWASLDLRGFERPRWFAQGPLKLTIAYLVARRSERAELAEELWHTLSCLNGTGVAAPGDFRVWWIGVRLFLWRYLVEALNPVTVERKLDQARAAVVSAYVRLLGRFAAKSEQRVPERRRPPAGGLFGVLQFVVGARGVGRYTAGVKAARGGGSGLNLGVAGAFWLVKRVHWAVITTARTVLRRLRLVASIRADHELYERLAPQFASDFPERRDQLSANDTLPLSLVLPYWKELLRHYDLVIGYSTDPIIPYAAGKPYFALEHGTLREIPFKPDRQGRLTALAYRHAEHVFVTNYDCLPNARLLAGERHSFINHPYDEDHGLRIGGVDLLRGELRRELDAERLIFYPTRHDWVQGTGYADKANDLFLRAVARLREQGLRIGLVCCKWGRNVSQSQALIASLGCAGAVRWVEPMGIIRFERTARACDVVADQFLLGAFGGVTFKALAVGVPVCTYIEGRLLEGLFGELPPVINCRTEEDIVRELGGALADGARLADLGARARAWTRAHHSGRATITTQVREFHRLLSKTTERRA